MVIPDWMPALICDLRSLMGYISAECGVNPHHLELNLPNLLNPIVQTCTKRGSLATELYLVPDDHPMHPKFKVVAPAANTVVTPPVTRSKNKGKKAVVCLLYLALLSPMRLIFVFVQKSALLIDEVLEAVGDGTTRVVSSTSSKSAIPVPSDDIGEFLRPIPGFSWAEDVEAMDSDSGEDESSDDEIEVSSCFLSSA